MFLELCRLSSISIHALVKRATYGILLDKRHSSNFNPRPREEGDLYLRLCRTGNGDFNPRPREEGDFAKQNYTMLDNLFQSTPS